MNNAFFSTVNKLLTVSREHKRLIDSLAPYVGIHGTHHRILMYLARSGQLPSQKVLAEKFHVTPSAITVALKKLEKDGYIQRRLGADNRYNQVDITDKGREVVTKTRMAFSQIDAGLFADFSEEELAQLCTYLDRIIANAKGVTINETMV